MKIQDIHSTDQALLSQYIANFASGDYDAALQVLANTQLNTKAMTAGVINAANAAVLDTENLYYNNVEVILAQKLAKFNQAIADLVNKSAYLSTVEYTKGNFVMYDNAVYVYVADTPTTGNLPTDTAYWLYLGLRGDKGKDGMDLTLRYQWSQNTQYAINDVVVYGAAMYYAITPSLNVVPYDGSTAWGVMFDIPIAKIYTDSLPPDYVYDGLIWLAPTSDLTWADVDTKDLTFDEVDALNMTWQIADYGGW